MAGSPGPRAVYNEQVLRAPVAVRALLILLLAISASGCALADALFSQPYTPFSQVVHIDPGAFSDHVAIAHWGCPDRDCLRILAFPSDDPTNHVAVPIQFTDADHISIESSFPVAGKGAVATVDLDGDGSDELVLAAGTLLQAISADGGQTTCDVPADLLVTGDFDGDGLADVAAGHRTTPGVTVFFGSPQAPAGLDCAQSVNIDLESEPHAMGISPGMPRAAILVATDGALLVSVAVQGDRTISKSPLEAHLQPGAQVVGFASGDFDGDHRSDLALQVQSSGSEDFVRIGVAGGADPFGGLQDVARGTVGTDLLAFRITLSHRPLDGEAGLFLAGKPGGQEGVVVVLHNKDFYTASIEDGFHGQPLDMAAADLNGDGTDDLVAPLTNSSGAPDIAVLLSDSP